MVTEDYVSFEIAKLLKEKEFDGKCYKVWVYYTSSTPMLWAAPTFVEGETIVDRESVESAERTWNTIYGDPENKNHGYLAPTLQMVMKWLREVHNIYLDIHITNHSMSNMVDIIKYYWVAVSTEDAKWITESTVRNVAGFKTYNEAAEDAIKYCLENLI